MWSVQSSVRAVCASAYRLGARPRVGLLPQYGPTFCEEIAMKRDWIEDGWRRFLDRLKGFWGKGMDTGPATA
jgi:hypothetical protein